MERTYEGVIFNGQIQLQGDVQLPENRRVYVVVPDETKPRVSTPRLVHPEQANEFQMEVIEEDSNAEI